MANAIHSEDEVKDSSDQGHEPRQSHPGDCGVRITLVQNHVPRRHHREQQPKPDGSDVPAVVHEITNGYCHCGFVIV